MDVTVEGLAPNTDFDLFVIQVPKSPFGVAWYQGDIQTGKHGRSRQQFVARFNVETSAFAQGGASAPNVFPNDTTVNPPFNPIQMYHLGLWFDTPARRPTPAARPGRRSFNGEHNAGSQVLNTSNFAAGRELFGVEALVTPV